MAEENEGASKTEDATPKKLEDARKKGDVAKSQDVAPLLALAATFAALSVGGGYISRGMLVSMRPFIERPGQMSMDGLDGIGVMRMALAAAWPPLAIVLGAAVFAGVVGNLAQHGLLWTTDKLKPDLGKLSPLKGFQRLFGVDGLVQFLKSLLKISIVGVVTWLILKPRIDVMVNSVLMEPVAILPMSMEIIRALFIAVIIFMGATAGADFFWQRFRFMERMKMTKEEMKEEHKNSEGDPHIKAKLRQMRMERSRRRMMQAVPQATVVIMNPTHYAVALAYEHGKPNAPKCVAKGLDSLALKIRAVAEEAGVPIVEDPPLARALYAAVDVDAEIPTAHYQAVAKIIGFILNKGRRAAAARPIEASAL